MASTQQSAIHRNLNPQELAVLVKLYRELRKWSQEQLAEIAGLSTRTVQRVEEGLPASTDTRRALARAF
ncbi:MAG: helix-turn-helix transcriptional regulator, partial [Raoultibacter sp.]